MQDDIHVMGGTTTAGDTNLRHCAKMRECEAEVMTRPLRGQTEMEKEECAGPVKNDRKKTQLWDWGDVCTRHLTSMPRQCWSLSLAFQVRKPLSERSETFPGPHQTGRPRVEDGQGEIQRGPQNMSKKQSSPWNLPLGLEASEPSDSHTQRRMNPRTQLWVPNQP